MEQNENTQHTTPVNNFRKWKFPSSILTFYLFVSYLIISALAKPLDPTQPCGMGLFFAMIFHFILAIMVVIALSLIFYFKKGYPLIAKIMIILLVLILPVISYFLF